MADGSLTPGNGKPNSGEQPEPSAYRIVVKNQSDAAPRFMLFGGVPDVSNISKVWQTVWVSVPGVQGPDGSLMFHFDFEVYAICGKGPAALQDGFTAENGDWRAVSVTKSTAVNMTIKEGKPKFRKEKEAFSITTDSSFKADENIFCGYGYGNRDSAGTEPGAVPVVVWQASPNQVYEIVPKRKFSVAIGEAKVGTITNPKLLKSVELDFTEMNPESKGKDVATLEFTKDYEFSKPVFTVSNPKAAD